MNRRSPLQAARVPLERRWTLVGVAGAVLMLFLGCAGEVRAAKTLRVRRTVVSLVSQTERWHAVESDPAHPVEAAVLAPVLSSRRDTPSLPCLVVVPPNRVEIDLAGLPRGADLDLALGFDRSSHEQGSGIVEFRIDVGGERRMSERLRFGADVKPAQAEWKNVRVPLGDARKLRLSTRLVRGEGSPRPGFARLHVTTEREVVPESATPARPSWIVVLVDTLRADRVGAVRDGASLTPNIDALVERGARFTQAYSVAPWTWPSTASVLTGLPPPSHGVLDESSCYLAPELETMAEALQDAGFATAAFSVNPLIRPERDFDQGFDVFHSRRWQPAPAVIADVIEHLRNVGERRSFVYVHLGDPHEYSPGEPFRSRIAGPRPEGYDALALRELMLAFQRGEDVDAGKMQTWMDYKRALYDASVAQVDQAMGELFAALEESGLAERTCLAFTSDHGEEFLEHGLVGHAKQLHHESLAVPLLLAGPGIPSGLVVDDPVCNQDLAATVLARAGVVDPAFAPGTDLLDPAARAAAGAVLYSHTRNGRWPVACEAGEDRWQDVHDLLGIRRGSELFVRAAGPDGQAIGRGAWIGEDGRAVELAADEVEALESSLESWFLRASALRPSVLAGGEVARELLHELGYVGEER